MAYIIEIIALVYVYYLIFKSVARKLKLQRRRNYLYNLTIIPKGLIKRHDLPFSENIKIKNY